jgi:ACR3 family arsenite transporter
MVIVWGELAMGCTEYCAGLVSLNPLFQVLFYSIYFYIFITVLSGSLGIAQSVAVNVTIIDIARSVFICLGISFLAGIITRFTLMRSRGKDWYEGSFIPTISPIAPIALLFTIVAMFPLKGGYIVEVPMDVFRMANTQIIHFLLAVLLSVYRAYKLGMNYKNVAAPAFTAASNSFELRPWLWLWWSSA